MATYYLSSGGSDSADGLSALTAWRTLAKAQSTLAAGDTLMLQGGSAFPGNLTLTVPVLIGAYGGMGRPVINAGAVSAITFQNCPGRVSGLSLRGSWDPASQTGNVGSGVLFQTDLPAGQSIANATIEDCDISGFGGRSDAQRGCGVEFFPGGGDSPFGGYRDPIVRRVAVSNCGLTGIYLTGWGGGGHNFRYWIDGGLIEDCQVQGITGQTLPGQGGSGAPGPFAGNGIIVQTARGLTVRGCSAVGNGAKGSGCVGIGMAYSADSLISRCQSLSQATAGGDGEGMGFDVCSFRCSIEDSYVEGSAGAGLYVCGCGDMSTASNGCAFRRNSVVNCGMNGQGNHGIDIGGPLCGCVAEDNTIFQDQAVCQAESLLRVYGLVGAMTGLPGTGSPPNVAQRNYLLGLNNPLLVMHCGPATTNLLTGNNYGGMDAQRNPAFRAQWEQHYTDAPMSFNDFSLWRQRTGQEPN